MPYYHPIRTCTSDTESYVQSTFPHSDDEQYVSDCLHERFLCAMQKHGLFKGSNFAHFATFEASNRHDRMKVLEEREDEAAVRKLLDASMCAGDISLLDRSRKRTLG